MTYSFLNSFSFLLCVSLSTIHTVAMANSGYGLLENDAMTASQYEIAKKATVAIIRKENLFEKNLFVLKDLYRYCTSQPFTEQKIWAGCSGTLVAKDVVLTAGHCVRNLADCENLSFALDFDTSSAIDEIRSNKNKLFSCKKIIYSSKPVPKTQLKDWALIQLTKPVLDRPHIELYPPQAPATADIVALGHPMGIAKKISTGFIHQDDNAYNIQNPKSPFYKSRFLTPAGLSGGGVYSADFKFFGIVVRGGAAYESDDGRCIVPTECTAQSCPWAEIQKVDFEKIKTILRQVK